MRKWIFGAVIILCVALGGFAVFQKLSGDRLGPEIRFDEELSYHDGMEEAELLEGVSASDQEDGDVSDTLVVEKITISKEGNCVVAVYAARDKANNITKVNRILSYSGTDAGNGKNDETEPEEEPAGTGLSNRPDADAGVGLGAMGLGLSGGASGAREDTEAESENGSGLENDGGAEEDTENASEEAESESEELEPGSPVVKLTETQTTIKKGDAFNPLIYVASIEDDYDNVYALWQDIQIDGEYDVNKTGEYELVFYVYDSAGNRSNRAKLRVRVE